MKLIFIFTIAVIAVIVATSPADLHNDEWNEFKIKYNKIYKNDNDEKSHMKVFLVNKQKIEKNNELFLNGKITYKLGVNHLTDLSEEEIRTFHKGYITLNNTQDVSSHRIYRPSNLKLPDTVDWRQKGAVTPVKNQGECGSCWAFSSTGSVEGQQYLKTGQLISLSEQNLVDCDSQSYGCGGGLTKFAFEYIQSNGGIDTESCYPYEAQNGYCRYDPANSGATVSGYVLITSGSESDLQDASANVGPISVSIDATGPFQSYQSGVYDYPDCSSSRLDHAVLVVGYGTENGQDYWLVKNSWGPGWGEEGYIKMSRNQNNQCGIATTANYPIV